MASSTKSHNEINRNKLETSEEQCNIHGLQPSRSLEIIESEFYSKITFVFISMRNRLELFLPVAHISKYIEMMNQGQYTSISFAQFYGF